MKVLGNQIAEIRKRKGYTQEQLAELSSINIRTLQRIEKGETQPQGNTLKSICQALEISIEEISHFGQEKDANFLIFFHLSVLTFLAIPMGNIIVPMVLWLTKRDKIVGLNEQGVNLLNFQILWSITTYLLVIVSAFLKLQCYEYYNIGFYMVALLYLQNTIYPIASAIMIKRGRLRRFYPRVIPFVGRGI